MTGTVAPPPGPPRQPADNTRADNAPADNTTADNTTADNTTADNTTADNTTAGSRSAWRGEVVVEDGDSPRRARPIIVGLAIVATVIVAVLVITGLTGFDGPGPLHRYPYRDLGRLAAAVNDQAGDIRTADDCWRQISGADGPLRDIAKVDYLRSRVVVRLYSRQLGQVDSSVRNRSEREIRALLADHPEFTRDMIVTEASPDGWSPALICRTTAGGRVAGF